MPVTMATGSIPSYIPYIMLILTHALDTLFHSSALHSAAVNRDLYRNTLQVKHWVYHISGVLKASIMITTYIPTALKQMQH